MQPLLGISSENQLSDFKGNKRRVICPCTKEGYLFRESDLFGVSKDRERKKRAKFIRNAVVNTKRH